LGKRSAVLGLPLYSLRYNRKNLSLIGALEMDQPLALMYASAGFLIWQTGGGSEAYGYRVGPRQYLLRGADKVNPPLEWDEPVLLQFTNQADPAEAWKKEFPSSREFFAYWKKEVTRIRKRH
jgi:hypothetical protein